MSDLVGTGLLFVRNRVPFLFLFFFTVFLLEESSYLLLVASIIGVVVIFVRYLKYFGLLSLCMIFILLSSFTLKEEI